VIAQVIFPVMQKSRALPPRRDRSRLCWSEACANLSPNRAERHYLWGYCWGLNKVPTKISPPMAAPRFPTPRRCAAGE
jgi:hypothetical protein